MVLATPNMEQTPRFHKKKVEKLPFQCNLCDASYIREPYLVNHRREYHSEDVEFPFKCPVCDYSTPGKARLLEHAKEHVEEGVEEDEFGDLFQKKEKIPP